jgi:hypothetical protein
MLRGKFKNRNSLPLLVTLTGCVLMFACLSPASASEITKQLSVKGYQLSRRNLSELHVVVTGEQQAKNILESLDLGFTSPGISAFNASYFIVSTGLLSYNEIFSRTVKRRQYEDLRSWLKRE